MPHLTVAGLRAFPSTYMEEACTFPLAPELTIEQKMDLSPETTTVRQNKRDASYGPAATAGISVLPCSAVDVPPRSIEIIYIY